jgi:hypothetical protein
MTDPAATPTPTTPKNRRRTTAELKAYLQARLKAVDSKEEKKIKRALERLAAEVQAIAVRRPGDPKIGQAAGLLTTAAAAIQVQVPQ